MKQTVQCLLNSLSKEVILEKNIEFVRYLIPKSFECYTLFKYDFTLSFHTVYRKNNFLFHFLTPNSTNLEDELIQT